VAKQTTSTPQRPAARAKAPGSDTAARRRNAPSPVTFFQESRSELRKVTWPTRQEAMNLTIAVIGMTVGLAAFLGLIDATLDYVIKPLIG
jgi:preprotein translocase subunit SecE